MPHLRYFLCVCVCTGVGLGKDPHHCSMLQVLSYLVKDNLSTSALLFYWENEENVEYCTLLLLLVHLEVVG